jgi:hypothetical protein
VLVAVTGFGRVWRHRLGTKRNDGRCFVRAVYYNTTGVVVDGHVRQRPRICGYARFDTVGGFNPNCPSRMVNRVFECPEPSPWMGYNKLLFKRLFMCDGRPDCFLAVAGSELTGRLAVGTAGWRSTDTWLLSLSESPQQQEAMLLMPAHGWIRGELGRFVLQPSEQRSSIGRLVLNCCD